ncbi:hypothetical protein KTR66_03140 [Roseococcus sp. SDR]|uniref:hypothetical protein n=1 Tax=Roseococcus sp. SDR TaxID=2835532 RepID=UPI001BCCD28F|nr:hypothetical protein [Roseococcus sp. SDR]MBS7788972.1 hypothetical protein [Roseococcus sp. SDR]MBV1844286.1 hypothetical protein [Roseococcus sp. SDR]
MSEHAPPSRRRFMALGSSALAASLLPSPALTQAELTPQRFGARGGDAAADTLGWNRAIEEASRTGRPVVGRGTYLLRVGAETHGQWGGKPDAPIRVAVQLRSNVTVQGAAEFVVAPPERPAAHRLERHFLFGTALNERPGTLRNITLDGVTFDFREEFGRPYPFTYACGVIGVDRFTRRDMRIRSTGAQAGRGLLSENARERTDRGITHTNIVQGSYTRYEQGVSMRGIRFERFNEALDFDGPCWDVVLDDLQFREGFREAQCIDFGGGARWQVTNVTAENTGPIAYLYIKGNGWPSYDSWLRSGERFTPDHVPPSDITIRGVRGRNAGWDGLKGEAVRVGTYRNRAWVRRQPGGAGPRNITLEDWELQGGGSVIVNDCEGLTIRRLRMSGTQSLNDGEAGAALVLREAPPEAGGAVTGQVSDVEIRNASHSGVIAIAGSQLSLTGITVRGFGRAEGRHVPAGIRLRPRASGGALPRLAQASASGGPPGAPEIDADRRRDPPEEPEARTPRERRRDTHRPVERGGAVP